jgi:hypothetical protein
MPPRALLLLAAALVAFVPGAKAAAQPSPKGPYDLKSGTIEYKSDFMGETKVIVHFDDYGAREARYSTSTIKVGGKSSVTSDVSIRTPQKAIRYDGIKKTGTSTRGSVPERQDEMALAPKEVRDRYKFQELPDRVILGRTCKGGSIEPSKGFPVRTWTWKGIPLLTQTAAGGGTMTLEAVRIDLEDPVPPEKFEPPDGLKLTTY